MQNVQLTCVILWSILVVLYSCILKLNCLLSQHNLHKYTYIDIKNKIKHLELFMDGKCPVVKAVFDFDTRFGQSL